MDSWDYKGLESLQGKVCIVTGANSGIGYETAKYLLCKGATVILACRNLRKAEIALNKIKVTNEDADGHIIELNLNSIQSIKSFVFDFNKQFDKLDILINNAGIMAVPQSQTIDGFERQLGVNYIGHYVLTALLLKNMIHENEARVVTVTSIAHKLSKIDFNDINFRKRKYKPFIAYGQSKLANLLFAFQLDEFFKENNLNIISLAAHPGACNTNLFEHLFLNKIAKKLPKLADKVTQKPFMGALPTLRAALDHEAKGKDFYGPSKFFEAKGEPVLVDAKDHAYNKEDWIKLWELTEELTNIKFEI